jgi:hypothetical protein
MITVSASIFLKGRQVLKLLHVRTVGIVSFRLVASVKLQTKKGANFQIVGVLSVTEGQKKVYQRREGLCFFFN